MTNKTYLNKAIVCSDGFTMSVQANEYAYCEPRCTHAERYDKVEVGYPSQREELLMEYAAAPRDCPTDTVYAYVPVALVYAVIVKHGGMISGELPNGIPNCLPELL
tara:strand:+ start:52 stop:369 length:318 start_codon:yes stop_codon:yes gene_type:complete